MYMYTRILWCALIINTFKQYSSQLNDDDNVLMMTNDSDDQWWWLMK